MRKVDKLSQCHLQNYSSDLAVVSAAVREIAIF